MMATLTPQFLQRFHQSKEDFKQSVCCQVDILFATFLNELKSNLHGIVPAGSDGRARYRSQMINGSSHYSPSSHHHQLSRPSSHHQRSMLNGNNHHHQYQNTSHSLTKAHQQPMLRTHRITSGPRSHSNQHQSSSHSVIAPNFLKHEFKADEEDFEAEDEEEEEEIPGLMLKGGSEEDEESEGEVSSDNELLNGQVNGFHNFANKRMKIEHFENKDDDEDEDEDDENEDDNDNDDPSEEMVVHIAPDEAILNAGAKGSPPSMLIPQTRMPSPLRIGDRLACPLDGCDRSYRHMKQYTSHQWTHRGIKPYICTFSEGPDESSRCQYMSEHPRNVIQHIRLLHFGIPRTIKEQKALGIVDDRDPAAFMQLRTDLDLG